MTPTTAAPSTHQSQLEEEDPSLLSAASSTVPAVADSEVLVVVLLSVLGVAAAVVAVVEPAAAVAMTGVREASIEVEDVLVAAEDSVVGALVAGAEGASTTSGAGAGGVLDDTIGTAAPASTKVSGIRTSSVLSLVLV